MPNSRSRRAKAIARDSAATAAAAGAGVNASTTKAAAPPTPTPTPAHTHQTKSIPTSVTSGLDTKSVASAPTLAPAPTATAPVTAIASSVFEIKSWVDYISVASHVRAFGLQPPNRPFIVLIGPSSHSPVQSQLLPKVAAAVSSLLTKTIAGGNNRMLWSGGDPLFTQSKRGGNISDVCRLIHTAQSKPAPTPTTQQSPLPPPAAAIEFGAVQRSDWIGKTPAFVKMRIGYSSAMAIVGGKQSFGGYSDVASNGLTDAIDSITQSAAAPTATATATATATDTKSNPTGKPNPASEINQFFLPPTTKTGGSGGGGGGGGVKTIYPAAASAGYLCLLPALCNASQLALIVIPRAGYITLQEVRYVYELIQRDAATATAAATRRVHVYVVQWKSVGDDLTSIERDEKCQLRSILTLLASIATAHPDYVSVVSAD